MYEKEIVKDLNGVINIVDDVRVFGVGKENFQNNVISFLDCCVERDLHFNPDKIQIDVLSVPFFGQTLTKQGLKMNHKKLEVIQRWPTPTNMKELQSLGSVNNLSKFIPYLSDFRKPLQDFLKKENDFVWLKYHDDAFTKLKGAIVKDMTLKHLNPNLPIYIETDASKKGIGVVLMQPDPSVHNTSKSAVPNNLRPVYDTSKTLTTTELNYSNIERKMLGVVFSVLHFKHFPYGRKVTVITDHKPLITLFKKYITASSPRLSQMLIKIIDFQVDLQHQEGSKMHLSDAISWFNTHDSDDARSKSKPIADFNISIHEVEDITGFKSLTMKQISSETVTDVQLEQLKEYIVDGFPKSKHECTELMRDFYDYRESLNIINGVVLKDKRIVIPTNLRVDTMSTLHRSHMGIVKIGLYGPQLIWHSGT